MPVGDFPRPLTLAAVPLPGNLDLILVLVPVPVPVPVPDPMSSSSSLSTFSALNLGLVLSLLSPEPVDPGRTLFLPLTPIGVLSSFDGGSPWLLVCSTVLAPLPPGLETIGNLSGKMALFDCPEEVENTGL